MVSFGDWGNLIGSSPVWAGVYATYDRTNQRYRIERDARRMRHGWRVKVLWVVSTDLESPARVRGHELGGGTSLWFEVEDRGETPVATATLDGAAPGGQRPRATAISVLHVRPTGRLLRARGELVRRQLAARFRTWSLARAPCQPTVPNGLAGRLPPGHLPKHRDDLTRQTFGLLVGVVAEHKVESGEAEPDELA